MDLLFDWFGISCMTTDNFCFYFQNSLIQTRQTGGQWYSHTSPFNIPYLDLRVMVGYLPLHAHSWTVFTPLHFFLTYEWS
jgi:hypothetical protein